MYPAESISVALKSTISVKTSEILMWAWHNNNLYNTDSKLKLGSSMISSCTTQAGSEWMTLVLVLHSLDYAVAD